MGWLGIVLSVVATWLLRDDGWLWLVAAAVVLLQFWTYGIMHNHAVESAKKREDYSGGFHDLDHRRLRCCAQLANCHEYGWVCRCHWPTNRWICSLTAPERPETLWESPKGANGAPRRF